jgi:hypothetical protein
MAHAISFEKLKLGAQQICSFIFDQLPIALCQPKSAEQAKNLTSAGCNLSPVTRLAR